MPANEIKVPFEFFSDIDGEPLEAGYIYVGQENLDPETNPIQAYWDRSLSVTATQPLRTTNGYVSNAGSPGNFYVNADGYSITVRNKNGSLIYTKLSVRQTIPFSALTGGATITTRVDSVAALIAGTWSEDLIRVSSYYGSWASTVDGPKGAFTVSKTGATNAAPSAGTPVTVSSIGAGDGSGSTTGQIAQVGLFWDASGAEWKYRYEDAINIASFGAIPGTSTTNAILNARALREAIYFIAGPVNTSAGGIVDLGDDQWVFGPTTIDEKWGWELRGNNQKIFFTGVFTILGCAAFKISDLFIDATTTRTHDGFVFDTGSATGERCHNFVFENVNLGLFQYGIYIRGLTSQCWFIGGQYGANSKSVYCASGFTVDHVYFNSPIFADHPAGSTAFDFRGNNWRLADAHFETNHGDANTVDIYAGGQQAAITGGQMTQSGGIVFNCNNGRLEDMIINRCSNNLVVDVQAGEVEVVNNTFRWDTNDGTGTQTTDGLGKTCIKAISTTKCVDNSMKRSGTGINTTGDNCVLDNNNINDPATYGYHLQNSDNVRITGGQVTLTQAGATGVYQQFGNAPNVVIDRVNWIQTAGTRYNFAGSQIQVHDSGTGSPEGVIYGGPGSTWSRINNQVEGRTNYVKTTGGSVNTGWRPLGSPVTTTTALNDITNIINTEDKFDGGMVFNTTTNIPVWATGNTAGAVWVDATGATAHTPV